MTGPFFCLPEKRLALGDGGLRCCAGLGHLLKREGLGHEGHCWGNGISAVTIVAIVT